MMNSYAGILLRMMASVALNVCVCAAVGACMVGWMAYGTASTMVGIALLVAWFVTPTMEQMRETCAYLKALQTSD